MDLGRIMLQKLTRGNFPQLNIYGEPLKLCSKEPLTGYFRDGCCNTDISDFGSHTVCAEMTKNFLNFSKATGNDLVTPKPEYGFIGLKSGDRWCLCASRWLEAEINGQAPLIFGESTNGLALKIIPREKLLKYLIKIN